MHRRNFDDLALDQGASGDLKSPYIVRWDDSHKFNSTAYCDARPEGDLPLDELLRLKRFDATELGEWPAAEQCRNQGVNRQRQTG